MNCVVPDLAFNRMDFLTEARRRDHESEHSSTEPPGSLRRGKGGMRGSSPVFVPRSESSEPMRGQYSEEKKAMHPQAWEQSDVSILVAPRPRTAPVEAGTICEPPRRRGQHAPARARPSLDSRSFSAPDRSSPHGAKSPRKEVEDYIGSTPEAIRRLLWETGVFDGVEHASHSTTDVHQPLGRPGGRASPPYQGTVAPTRERVQCADKSTMATLPGAGDYSALRPSSGPQAIAKADRTHETDAAIAEYRPQDRVEPFHRRVPDLTTVHTAVIASAGDGFVDRTKIALMAHIPVYCHQESQTESPWQMPQNPAYTHAGTQTTASPTHYCGRGPVTEDARFSPVQRHISTEGLSLSGELLTYGDSPIWEPDDADSRIFPNHLPYREDEVLSRFTSGCHQAHPTFQQQTSLESQGQLHTKRNGFEGPIPLPHPQTPCQPDGPDALSFVTSMENDTALDEGSSVYPHEHDGRHTDSQEVGVKTSNDDCVPVHCHLDGEMRAYHHPYPLQYKPDTVAAVQQFDTGDVVLYPHRSAFRMLAQEPPLYPQETPYPPEPLLRRSRPAIHDPDQNEVPSCGRNTAEYIQDENQVNMGGQPHAFAYRQQRTRDDLEQDQLEAYWRNRQLEFARRYGY